MMPNKDPSFLQMLYQMISENTTLQGAMMATIIATLRVLYDEKNTKPTRIILEALICGALSLCISGIIEIFQLPNSAGITLGGAIGFIGVNTLRNFILKSINKRTDNK